MGCVKPSLALRLETKENGNADSLNLKDTTPTPNTYVELFL